MSYCVYARYDKRNKDNMCALRPNMYCPYDDISECPEHDVISDRRRGISDNPKGNDKPVL